MQAVEEGGGGEERNARFEESDLDSEISKLRGRWELASVLNFLDVRDLEVFVGIVSIRSRNRLGHCVLFVFQ